MQQAALPSQGHTLSMRERETLSLTGVEDVLHFDEATITCRTTLGDLVIEGSSLHITDFSAEKSTLTVEGSVSALFYEDKKERAKGRFLFGRLRP